MKKLLQRISLFFLFCAATAGPVLYYIADSTNDRFCSKFKYRTVSIITGSSRALLGLNPDQIVPDDYSGKPVLNFAFTQSTSPYGEIYFHAIEAKIRSGNGLCILEVNPVSVSAKGETYPEEQLILGRLRFFNMNPNIDYAIQNAQFPPYLFAFSDRHTAASDNNVFHENGWNEFLRLPAGTDTAANNRNMYEAHQKLFHDFRISDYRLSWLQKTISLLSENGKVVLLRMPVSPQMQKLETAYCPGFDQQMQEIANANGATYLNLYDTSGWTFYDLHHMDAVSASRFSELVGDTLTQMKIIPADVSR